jgi:glycosyltransferase involved in cell wall biosynthesis
MSYGKPIISTNVGGIPRILENKINGLVIEPGNKHKLKEAIETYLNDSKMVSIHGEKGLKKVEEYYPESVIKKLNIIYEGLL